MLIIETQVRASSTLRVLQRVCRGHPRCRRRSICGRNLPISGNFLPIPGRNLPIPGSFLPISGRNLPIPGNFFPISGNLGAMVAVGADCPISKGDENPARFALALHLQLNYARPHARMARAAHPFQHRFCGIVLVLDPQWAKETAASARPFFLLRPLLPRSGALQWNSQQINTECRSPRDFLNPDNNLRFPFNTEAATEAIC